MTEISGSSEIPKNNRWDHLTHELNALRLSVGEPSFAEISRRITRQRMGETASEHAARVARSTVYDAFRTGRTRVDLPLVREIVHALGGDEAVVNKWVEACNGNPSDGTSNPLTPPPAVKQVAVLMVSCVVLNLLGRQFVDFFQFPIYLDMIGTAIAAIALGPWRGAAVGVTTNIIGTIGSGWISLPFALVNIVGALIWGYGVRRWRMGRTLPRFFALNVITAFACSLVAVPIIVIFLGDDLNLGHNVITQLVEESVNTFAVAVGFSNLLTSLGDKLISGFVALVVISSLPLNIRATIPLIFADHPDSRM